MNLPKILSLFALVFCSIQQANAQYDTIQYAKGVLVVHTSLRYSNTGTFYDSTGTTVSNQIDVTNGKNYVSAFTKTQIELHATYAADSTIQLQATIPISVYSLQEDYTVNGQRISTKSNLSRTSLEYYKLGAEYLIRSRNKIRSSLFGSITSAPAISSSGSDSTFYPLLPAGAMIWELGLMSSLRFATTELRGNVSFRMRTAGLANEFNIKGEIRMYALRNAILSFYGNFVQTLGSRRNIVFDKRYMPLQESYFAFGAGLGLKLSEQLFGTAFYDVRAFGNNAWALGTFGISAGYVL